MPEDPASPDPNRGSRTRRVAGNTAVQSASTLGILIIGLVITPVSLNRLGLIVFGIWGYVSTTIGYLAVVDPGFGLIVTRYAARARTADERTVVRRIVTFAILAWLLLLAVLSPAVLVVVPTLVHHLHLDASDQRTAITVFYWAYAYFFLSIASDTITRIMVGIGQLWLASIIDFATRLTYGVLALVLLIKGFGIWALIVASTVQVVLSTIAVWIALRRSFGPVLGNPFRIERSVFRDLVKSGGWFQVASVLGALNSDTDPIVIGTFVGPTDVGIYSVATRLAGQTAFLPGLLQKALLPAVAASRPDDPDHDRVVRTAVINGNRLTSLMSFAAGLAIIGLSPVIYRAWLGHLYPGVDTATAILIVAGLAAALGITVATVLFSTGQISLVAKIVAGGVVANVALTVALVVPFGMVGVLIGTVVANGTIALVGIFLLNRQIGLSLQESVWTWLWRLLIATGVAAGACRLILAALPGAWQVDRGRAFGTLCLLGLIYTVILLLGLRLTRFFHDGDVTLLQRVLPGPLRRLAGWTPVLWFAGVTK